MVLMSDVDLSFTTHTPFIVFISKIDPRLKQQF